MTGGYDSLVIGAGHNGLVAAALLAQAGRKVLVVEASERVGGCAATEEFAPGFHVSSAAHLLHLLHPEVERRLELARHGLTLAARDMSTVALGSEARHLVMPHALRADDSLEKFSTRDSARLTDLRDRLMRFAGFVHAFQATVPPRLAGGGLADRATTARMAWQLRRLGRDDMREFLRIGLSNVADVLNDELECDILKGAIGLDAVLGTGFGPRSPNSLFSLLYRLAGQSGGVPGALSQPRGGMGAVTGAMAAAARAAGVDIRTEAPVAHILVENDRAAGVELASGEVIGARSVVSGVDPKTTLLDLLGAAHLDTGFVRRIRAIRAEGMTAKLHLALDGLPEFAGVTRAQLAGRLVIAPSLDALETAFNPCKYGQTPERPGIEITIPTLSDPGLAPNGKHVLSAVVQYAPYRLKAGWEASREAFVDRVVAMISEHAPELKKLILAREFLAPPDIEARFGVAGGHWHHAELAPDQLLMMRPVPGAGQYATPMPGLWLCGAGTHPGGGVMGAAGLNAARRVLAVEGRR